MSIPARIEDGETARRRDGETARRRDGESLSVGWGDDGGGPSPSPTPLRLPSPPCPPPATRVPGPSETREGERLPSPRSEGRRAGDEGRSEAEGLGVRDIRDKGATVDRNGGDACVAPTILLP